ncbi:phage tail protein [Acinetobacter schindleri]|uniref:phage tail protein n=1 Tax=Acinetobacter schindleri TaxID=108981 RepID=UPI0022F38B34|nr:phage tail protein [Acinetobacter schindleri]WBX38980.1 phage tail protein [Acinetobacter schindleri]
MSSDYYNVLTNIGSAKITEMLTTQQKLQNLTIAFGDGGGSVPTPSKTRTTLVNEVHRRPADKFYRHPTLTNNIVVEVTIPSNIGGFWIREFGIFFENAMICHGSLAPSYKEASTDGFSTYRLKPYLNIGTDQIDVLEISGDLVTATESWTDEFYVPRDEIVDNLTTDEAGKPVSAKQAKVLQDNKLDKNANAASASKLETSRQVSFSGAATGSFNFDGSAGTSCTLTLANSGATAGTYGTTLKVPVITVNAKGLITTVTTQDIPKASTSAEGLVELATNAQTLAGTDATRAVTPAALMSLFANTKAETGYTKLPNGLIIQWGSFVPNGSQAIGYPQQVTLPIAFPSATVFAIGSEDGGATNGTETAQIDLTKTTKTQLAFYTNYINSKVLYFAMGY